MPWFIYTGKVPKSIPVKKGLSVAAVPHCRIEIFDTSLREIQVLRRKGELKSTGKPVDAPSNKVATVVNARAIAAVTPKSAMAKITAEKGKTNSPAMAPRLPRGRKPEMTDGELAIVKGTQVAASKPDSVAGQDDNLAPVEDLVADAAAPETAADAGASEPGGQSEIKDAEEVEVLSNDDGSPEGSSEGEETRTRKKKRRRK